jgi:hypothetical protein
MGDTCTIEGNGRCARFNDWVRQWLGRGQHGAWRDEIWRRAAPRRRRWSVRNGRLGRIVASFANQFLVRVAQVRCSGCCCCWLGRRNARGWVWCLDLGVVHFKQVGQIEHISPDTAYLMKESNCKHLQKFSISHNHDTLRVHYCALERCIPRRRTQRAIAMRQMHVGCQIDPLIHLV